MFKHLFSDTVESNRKMWHSHGCHQFFSSNVSQAHRCRSKQLFGGAKDILPKFPYIFTKSFYATNIFPPFHCGWWYIIFSSTIFHRLENRKFRNLLWFSIIQLKRSTLGCARTLPEACWLSRRRNLPHTSEVWPFIYHLLVSARNLIPSEVQLKLFPFSENIYVIYASCVLLYVYTMPWENFSNERIICRKPKTTASRRIRLQYRCKYDKNCKFCMKWLAVIETQQAYYLSTLSFSLICKSPKLRIICCQSCVSYFSQVFIC